MKSKYIAYGVAAFLLLFAAFTVQPFAPTIDAETTLVEQPGTYASEIRRLPDATYLVAVRTPMPGVSADMVRWWFSDFMQTTEHYTWWHPDDHLWMDWENKKPGEIVGASHLVHEYIGDEISKLRIQFVEPSEFFGYDPNEEDLFVLCARVGLLEEPINVTKMCHIVRNTDDGAEMRSRFWLGHVAKRSGNETNSSLEGLIGNSYLARSLLLNEQLAQDLHTHATEEMSILSGLLPRLYAAREAN